MLDSFKDNPWLLAVFFALLWAFWVTTEVVFPRPPKPAP